MESGIFGFSWAVRSRPVWQARSRKYNFLSCHIYPYDIMRGMKICVPELENPVIQEVVKKFTGVEFVTAEGLIEACRMVKQGEADTLLSGLDYSSRDVLLACKEVFAVTSRYFSSSAEISVFEKKSRIMIWRFSEKSETPWKMFGKSVTVRSAASIVS